MTHQAQDLALTMLNSAQARQLFDALVQAQQATATYRDKMSGIYVLSYLGLGLAGESGEAVDCIKKIYRDNFNGLPVLPERFTKLDLELGDVWWYWVGLCAERGISPADVIAANILKLMGRQAEGTLVRREG